MMVDQQDIVLAQSLLHQGKIQPVRCHSPPYRPAERRGIQDDLLSRQQGQILRVLRILIKFVVVNASLLLSFVLCLFVFGVTYDDLFERGKVFVVLFLLGMDFLLFLYDFLVRRLQDIYVRKLRKKLLRLFK